MSAIYVAMVNVPGYMPDTDTPLPTFDNTFDAWSYLVEERKRHEDDAWDGTRPGYSTTVDELRKRMLRSRPTDYPDVVLGANPDNPNVTLAYSVEVAETYHEGD